MLNWQVTCASCKVDLRFPDDLIETLDRDKGIEDMKLGEIQHIRCKECGAVLRIYLSSTNKDSFESDVLSDTEIRAHKRETRLFKNIIGFIFFAFGCLLGTLAFTIPESPLWIRIVCVPLVVVFVSIGVIAWIATPADLPEAERIDAGETVRR